MLAWTSRLGRLPPSQRTMVNALGLVAGPVAWAIHLNAYFRHAKSGDSRPEEKPAGVEGVKPRAAAAVPGATQDEVPVVEVESAPEPRRWSILKWFGRGQEDDELTDRKLLNEMMLAAIAQQGTDIHLEPYEDHYLARIRVNGILRDYQQFTRDQGEHLVAMVKVMASMDVADRMKPQDGRFEYRDTAHSLRLDIRVSASPALRGEKLAIRFLNRPNSSFDLENLGMNETLRKSVRRAIRHPEGFILIAGPTGSGKTSTAYALLHQVAGPSVNTVTIEDPVEYSLPYATQIAVSQRTGITFETGLTTMLRQDPDVIFVGEMRDAQSFRIGIRASLSGHLVLSTVHARDSVQVFSNLRNVGIEPASLAAAVKMVIAQRLVRILCPHCRVHDDEFDDDVWEFLGEQAKETPVYQPGDGCEECFQSGFIGRTGIFEMVTMDTSIREWLETNGQETQLRTTLRKRNVQTMREDAREKVFQGNVWVQDAIRAAGWD